METEDGGVNVVADQAHLDSHQHVHRDEPVRSVLLEKAQRLRDADKYRDL